MKLLDYLKANGISDDAFASAVGTVTASAVRKWKYRERTPRLDDVFKIERVTGGAVTLNDFLDEPLPAEKGDAA